MVGSELCRAWFDWGEHEYSMFSCRCQLTHNTYRPVNFRCVFFFFPDAWLCLCPFRSTPWGHHKKARNMGQGMLAARGSQVYGDCRGSNK